MRHGRKIQKLGMKTDHRKAMMANMATSLFRRGRITTTLSRAKALSPFVERLVSFAIRGDLHARRLAASTIRDKEVLKRLFAEIGPELKERKGGYTRLVRAGFRRGDGASLAVIELLIVKKVVKEEKEKKEEKKGEKTAPAAKETEAPKKKSKKEAETGKKKAAASAK